MNIKLIPEMMNYLFSHQGEFLYFNDFKEKFNLKNKQEVLKYFFAFYEKNILSIIYRIYLTHDKYIEFKNLNEIPETIMYEDKEYKIDLDKQCFIIFKIKKQGSDNVEVSKNKIFCISKNFYEILKNNKEYKYFLVHSENHSKVIVVSSLPVKFDDNCNPILKNYTEYSILKEKTKNEFSELPFGLHGKIEELLKQSKIKGLKKYSKKHYSYLIDDEKLSEEFFTINELIETSLDDIDCFEIDKDTNGKYFYLDIVETEIENYSIDGESIIENLKSQVYNNYGDSAESYLEDVNIKDFEEEINKFWKKYKKKNNIREMITEKNNTKKTYKVYFKENKYSYELIRYVKMK